MTSAVSSTYLISTEIAAREGQLSVALAPIQTPFGPQNSEEWNFQGLHSKEGRDKVLDKGYSNKVMYCFQLEEWVSLLSPSQIFEIFSIPSASSSLPNPDVALVYAYPLSINKTKHRPNIPSTRFHFHFQ